MTTTVKTDVTTTNEGVRFPLAAWIAMGVLAIAGLIAWGTQLSQGLVVTAIDRPIVWGLYIAGFFLSAG